MSGNSLPFAFNVGRASGRRIDARLGALSSHLAVRQIGIGKFEKCVNSAKSRTCRLHNICTVNFS
jgi:hypothetical protein